MKTVGQPYAVATPSVAGARAMLAVPVSPDMRAAGSPGSRRSALELIADVDRARWLPTHSRRTGNFVFARMGAPGEAVCRSRGWRRGALRVRWFTMGLDSGRRARVRITCPGESAAFEAIFDALPESPAGSPAMKEAARVTEARTAEPLHFGGQRKRPTIELSFALDGERSGGPNAGPRADFGDRGENRAWASTTTC